MVGTLEGLACSAANGDGAPAMQADVRQRPQCAFAIAAHDDLLMRHGRGEVLTRVLYLVRASDACPDVAEQGLHLEIEELLRCVPVIRQGARTFDAPILPRGYWPFRLEHNALLLRCNEVEHCRNDGDMQRQNLRDA